MDTQEITLNQDSDDGLYTRLLRGRYVTSIDNGTITLDDGTELYIHGNEGCGSCESGAGTGSKTSTNRGVARPAS